MTKMDRGITTLYKKLIWAAHCMCWHVYRICTSFYYFKSADQTNGCTRLKRLGRIAAAGGHVALRLLVLRGTCLKCQRGKLYNMGSSELVKFQARDANLGRSVRYGKGMAAPY